MTAFSAQSQDEQIRLLKRNFVVLNAMSFFRMFLIIMPIFVPFMAELGLSMAETMALQSVYGITVIVLEVPSGYLADMWGRKKTLMAASIFWGLGFSVFLWAENFWQFALFEFFLGVGGSLLSGADVAMLYETESALDELEPQRKKKKGNHISSMVSWMTLGEALAAVTASFLLLHSMTWVIYGQVLVGWVGFVLVFLLHEPDFKRMDEGSHKKNLLKVVKHLTHHDKRLTQLIVIAVLMFTATWLAAWAYQPLWLSMDIPLDWFGWLWAGSNLAVAMSAKAAPNLMAWLGHKRAMLTTVILAIVGFAGLSWQWGLSIFIFGLGIQVARGFGSVVFRDEINRTFQSEFRATANSLIGLVFRIMTITCGPLLGFSIDQIGIGMTLWVITGFYLLVLLVLVIPWILAPDSPRGQGKNDFIA